MTTTAIEWTDKTWNPVRGCSMVSAGCANCYAMKQAHRFSGQGKPYEGLTEIGPQGPRWTGKIRLVPELLDEPLRWKKPCRIFVNSMSDLFHEDVPDAYIASVFGVMAAAKEHTFQVLTKRPERMQAWFRWIMSHRPGLTRELVRKGGAWPKVDEYSAESVICAYAAREVLEPLARVTWAPWPLPNVWLGVSVEDQKAADERIPILLNTPSAVRWISAEPLLGPINLERLPIPPAALLPAYGTEHGFHFNALCRDEDTYMHSTKHHLDWVVVGGESGPHGVRPCDIGWIRSIVKQCRESSVPVFVKQLGYAPRIEKWPRHEREMMNFGRVEWLNLRDRKGGDPSEWPEDLRVREWPR